MHALVICPGCDAALALHEAHTHNVAACFRNKQADAGTRCPVCRRHQFVLADNGGCHVCIGHHYDAAGPIEYLFALVYHYSMSVPLFAYIPYIALMAALWGYALDGVFADDGRSFLLLLLWPLTMPPYFKLMKLLYGMRISRLVWLSVGYITAMAAMVAAMVSLPGVGDLVMIPFLLAGALAYMNVTVIMRRL